MPALSLVFPMLAMVLLTFGVAVVLFRARMRSVREGLVPIAYFRTFEGATEPEFLVKPTRHFINLFEAPTLFYAGCLAAMVTGATGPWAVGLAWAYVAARLVHAGIHLGSNRLRWRMRAYLVSWICLLALWIHVALRVVATE
jgi:hypothetical protein